MNRFKNWRKPIIDEDGWALSENVDFDFKPYGWRCQHSQCLKLGNNVDIGCFTYMNAKYGIEIGDNVQIGSHCSIYSDNTENNTHGKVVIGENSLIGSFSLILPNTVISPNSKINAYSIIKE
jgi:acetyltransferase-like isoleucine patch superfamily enzyme